MTANLAGGLNAASWKDRDRGATIEFAGEQINLAADYPALKITGTKLSVFATIRPGTMTGSTGRIFDKQTPFAGSGYTLRIDGETGDALSATIEGTNYNTAANVLTANVVQRVGFTYDGINLRFWRDGKLIGTTALTVSISDDAAVPTIGNRADGSRGYPGMIFDVQVWARPLSAEEVQQDAVYPYGPPLYPRLALGPRKVVGGAASGGGGVSGTLATTNANDTSAAAGTTAVLGTLARTNAADTSAASGTTTVLGALARTNANDTSAATGNVGILGTLARTNSADTSAAAGTPIVNGSLATTNSADTLAASGSPVVNGALARTNANDTVVASGSAGAAVGTSNTTNANDTAVASGTTTVVGSASITNANDTASALGTVGLEQGGGGGKKRKPFKSWDQRQREREAELKAQQEAIAARLARENRDKYGDLPPALAEALGGPQEPTKPLSAHTMREYERVRLNGDRLEVLRNDDEEAFALILAAL